MTAGGINAGGKVITGVADAVDAADAVNKGQLDNLADGAVHMSAILLRTLSITTKSF